tara:strand:- start:46075 stop:47103 length:1029 start_codon:yes stop_codon:yes gene_type:complete
VVFAGCGIQRWSRSVKQALVIAASLLLGFQAGNSSVLAQPMVVHQAPVVCLAAPGVESDRPLVSRIGRPDPAVMDIFSGAGASAFSVHDLTEDELILVEKALGKLPRLHRDVLRRHLRRLSFLDLQPGAGSALTSRAGLDDASMQFDITLRASLLDESLAKFLNDKESRLFADDDSGFSVEFDAGQSDALTYILLHEANHIVDQVIALTADTAGPFRSKVWKDLRAIAPPHDASLAAKNPFRRARPIPLRYAPAYYESLANSPFVSFYATAAATEDVAELFAWQQLASRFDQSLTITIRDNQRLILHRYEPLETPFALLRFGDVQAVFEKYEQACRRVGGSA